MKRLFLYPLVSVVMLAGEPAVGASMEPQAAPALSAPLLAPLDWLASVVAFRGAPPRTAR